jgi:hypothetical protein
MRFALIDGAKAQFPVRRLCRVLSVSQSGYFAWRGRPACRRQRDDMVLLAHVRSAFALSNSTYGSPRMPRELREGGLMVGRRRIARLMRDNGLRARQKRRFKLTTDSHQSWLEILSFNVLLGWTVLGWIGALIWSFTAPRWETTIVATERFRGEDDSAFDRRRFNPR